MLCMIVTRTLASDNATEDVRWEAHDLWSAPFERPSHDLAMDAGPQHE